MSYVNIKHYLFLSFKLSPFQYPFDDALLTLLLSSLKLKLKYHSKIPSNIPPTLIFVLSNFQFIFNHLITLSFLRFLSPIFHTPIIKYFISPITTIITLYQHPLFLLSLILFYHLLFFHCLFIRCYSSLLLH